MGSLQKNIRDKGYSFLAKHRTGDFGPNVVAEFGTIADFCRDRPVHELTPRSREQSTPNTYSGLYGFDDFPLHTDFAQWTRPPRYLLLRCINGFSNVKTRFVDAYRAVDLVGESILFRGLVRPRRMVCASMPLLRLVSRPAPDTQLVRWDREYLRPASKAGRIGLQAFADALSGLEVINISLSRPGDTLIIDNWRMLHGRSAVPSTSAGRVIQRSYLETLN